MTDIAVLGAGRVGTTLAAGLAKAGHSVAVATRDGTKPASWQGPEARFTTVEDAIAGATVVVNALPGDTAVATLTPHSGALAGKIVVDVANATTRGADGMPGGLAYSGSSLGEALQAALPETKIVKTLNTMLFPVMINPGLVANASVFLSGDDAPAKGEVKALLQDMGWSDDSIEDIGGIASARATEAFIVLVPAILKARGMKPFAFSLAR